MIKKNIPNTLTCANLFSGCIGIIFAFKGELQTVALFVIISGIFDFFDGFAARWLNVKSEIGKELDSLADVISFGLLPGVVMYQMLQDADAELWAYAGFLIPIFSAIRLAKFNIDDRQTEDFIGLNTPMNTFFIISLPFLSSSSKLLYNPYFLIAIIVLVSFLLVSNLKLFSMKMKQLTWESNKYKFIFLILSIVLLAFLKFAAFPLILLFYIIFSQLHFKYSK
jgi:CDP-diacylglycerol--serine O-phosphatidyltransferase